MSERVHVTPADPMAAIPDPARGRDLPPEGAEVVWSAYWAGMERRGEVTMRPAGEVVPVADAVPAAEPEPAEPEATSVAPEPSPEGTSDA